MLVVTIAAVLRLLTTLVADALQSAMRAANIDVVVRARLRVLVLGLIGRAAMMLVLALVTVAVQPETLVEADAGARVVAVVALREGWREAQEHEDQGQ